MSSVMLGASKAICKFWGDASIADVVRMIEEIGASLKFDDLRYRISDYLDVKDHGTTESEVEHVAVLHFAQDFSNPRRLDASVAMDPGILALLRHWVAVNAIRHATAPGRLGTVRRRLRPVPGRPSRTACRLRVRRRPSLAADAMAALPEPQGWRAALGWGALGCPAFEAQTATAAMRARWRRPPPASTGRRPRLRRFSCTPPARYALPPSGSTTNSAGRYAVRTSSIHFPLSRICMYISPFVMILKNAAIRFTKPAERAARINRSLLKNTRTTL